MCQVVIRGVVMGDKNAVYAVSQAGRRALLTTGVLTSSDLLLPGMPFPTWDVFGDIYIDDHALIALIDASQQRLAGVDSSKMRQFDIAMKSLGIPLSDKHLEAETDEACFWGGALRGKDGILAYPMSRVVSLQFASFIG